MKPRPACPACARTFPPVKAHGTCAFQRLAAAGAMVSALLVGGVASVVAAPRPLQQAPRAEAVPACASSQLAIGGIGASAATGTGIVTLRATNISRSTCGVEGRPHVSFIEAVGSAIPVHVSHDGPGPAFAAPEPVVLAPGAKAGFVITSADDMDTYFACRTAAELKVSLPRVSGTTTVPTETGGGPSEYLLCAVPPAIPVVNVSSVVPEHEVDPYAPASTVGPGPPGSASAATPAEVERFVARAAAGFDGPVQLSYTARTSVGTAPTTLDATIASATSWSYQASPSIFSVRSSGTSAAVFMNPRNETPGLYSCVRSAPRAAWACRSDASAAMGGRAELLGPSPQVALLDGLQNAVTVYANPASLGNHFAAEVPHLLDQGAGADAESCLLYGPVGSPVAFVCLDTGGIIARYQMPQAVTSSSYVTAVLTSKARSLPPWALKVPGPLPDAATQTLARVASGSPAGRLEPPPAMAAPPSQAGTVLVRGLENPTVWLGPHSLYLVTSSAGSAGVDTIRRLGLTGRAEATGHLPGSLTSWPRLVLSGGSMWVTVWQPTRGATGAFELIGLNPASLRVRHVLTLGGPPEIGLAPAGGWVWAETSRYLAKVSPGTGKLEGTVALPAPRTEDLASDSTGKVLASAHFDDVVDLLNPFTGRTVASYKGGQGEGAQIAGIADGQVFTETGTGNSSIFQRLDLADGKFHSVYGWGYSPQLVVSGNRFMFNAYAGYGAGAQAPNYCGLTATGKPLAMLPGPATPLQGRAVGYAAGALYYLTTPPQSTEVDLEKVGLPGCR